VRGLRIVPEVVAEARRSTGTVVVLALDGINDSAARAAWSQAQVETLTSTFPTTSVTVWLTAATGLEPAEHGVLGVVYYLPEAGTCFHVFLDRGLEPVELPPRRMTDAPTFFERARDEGVRCLANPGELASWPSAWTDAILRGAERVASPTDWTALRHDPVGAAEAAVRETEAALGPGPRVVWTFVNFDDYLHRRGYDDAVLEALARLERAAAEWAAAGHAVVAYADHGLVESRSDDEARRAWTDVTGPELCRCAPGGAGRVRWAYPLGGKEDELAEAVTAILAGRGIVTRREELIAMGLLGDTELVAARVGEVVALATGRSSPLSDADAPFDHGSWEREEMLVPLAIWSG
jgi:Type I phosphodiesterase / nucleotide pyrophosphatase